MGALLFVRKKKERRKEKMRTRFTPMHTTVPFVYFLSGTMAESASTCCIHGKRLLLFINSYLLVPEK